MATTPNSGPIAPPPPVWNAQPAGAGPVEYAGFVLRVVACVVDVLVALVIAFILRVIYIELIVFRVSGGDLELLWYGNDVIELAVFWLYFAIMESSARGATLGKMSVQLRVVTDRGQRLSFANATGRFFAKFVSAIILGIGFVMAAFTDKKRGLHDMIAGTLVIRSR